MSLKSLRSLKSLAIVSKVPLPPATPAVQNMRANLAQTVCLGLWLLAGCGLRSQAAEAAPAPIRIVSYNLYNFTALNQPQIKTPESRAMVVSVLNRLDPDIAVLIELSGPDALEELAGLLKKAGSDYPFHSLVEPPPQPDRRKKDQTFERRIGILSKIAPAEIKHELNQSYNLNGRAVPVQRGFAHLIYKWPNGYTLHLLGAHLKSKMFDARGQTDMRRNEARQLRYLVNDILKAEPEANLLVVGDLNDTPDSSPITTLYNRRARKPELHLFDLRPVDGGGLAWTHLQEEADDYARIDYALASHGLLPEISFAQTIIPDVNDWYIASDHRPLQITIIPADRPVTPAVLDQFERNIRKPAVPASTFHPGPVTGARKLQHVKEEKRESLFRTSGKPRLSGDEGGGDAGE